MCDNCRIEKETISDRKAIPRGSETSAAVMKVDKVIPIWSYTMGSWAQKTDKG